MEKNTNNNSLKIFFIKLFSISIAVIVIINVLFNLIVSDKMKHLDILFSLDELENRRELGNQLRQDLQALLEKDNLINKEDKILIYKLYQKIKLEFKDIKE
ncbi:MAG: hypothetical protein CMG67_01220 [Candidatus Marinimicrobia bacterium]|nr:hypothetical protein [Candidatus Neomarinimicrobiota bacterium]|tara:strand:- start:18555 stop:18857 length:303 start_codon:yes stop_codon:yes gene_type:complete